MAKKEKVSIEKTKCFFKHAMGIKLTSEEARVATERIVGLFELLDKWNKEHLLPLLRCLLAPRQGNGSQM